MSGIGEFYSAGTVRGYTEKFEKIGVNPICIDTDTGKNKGVSCIKSLYKRCMEIAEKDYFK